MCPKCFIDSSLEMYKICYCGKSKKIMGEVVIVIIKNEINNLHSACIVTSGIHTRV